MNKKAQVELIGLVFIVLIITIVLLFYVSYSFQDDVNPETSTFTKYADSELSFSFIDVMLHTSVCGTTMKELMIDCAKYQKLSCDDGTKSSCEKVNETINTIKEATLDEWDYAYGLVVDIKESPESPKMYYNYTYGCVPNEVIVGKTFPGLFYLGLNPNNLRIELGLCK